MPIDHYENFPVASLLVPRRLRPAVVNIYRFARSADDLADEGNAAQETRLQQLDAYRRQLEKIEKNAPDLATSGPLADV
ncbi:MAG: squalene/phytoene synthase family protein, partial [Pusillimonas sp.]|nr:squalene/phytoene synthase family protein [Pusillimonas sp.]